MEENKNTNTSLVRQNSLPTLTENAVNTLSTYGDFERGLCMSFPAKDRGMLYPTLDYACKADAPTLVTVDNAYGEGSALTWLTVQLTEVAMFTGLRDKLTRFQTESCARQLRKAGYFVTMAEMMQFFDRFEQGYYEQFRGYERPNPQVITSSFNTFLGDLLEARNRVHSQQEADKLREQQKEWKQNAVPCPEHIKEHLKKFYEKFNSK